jgi:predicted nucleic acid-binding Zn ribbon protein
MNNKSEWFIIEDFEGFVNSSRQLVFKNLGENNNEDIISTMLSDLTPEEVTEMNELLTFEECASIIQQKAKRKKRNTIIKYYINDSILMEIIEDINSRLVSNILNSLANKGVIQTGYDSEKNDFIFWIEDDNKKEKT